jgi:NADP-dependent aldehyde dehydrogenase
MNDVPSIDPRTGTVVEVVTRETELAQLEAICRAAASAAGPDALEEQRDAVVQLADRETALGATRLA